MSGNRRLWYGGGEAALAVTACNGTMLICGFKGIPVMVSMSWNGAYVQDGAQPWSAGMSSQSMYIRRVYTRILGRSNEDWPSTILRTPTLVIASTHSLTARWQRPAREDDAMHGRWHVVEALRSHHDRVLDEAGSVFQVQLSAKAWFSITGTCLLLRREREEERKKVIAFRTVSNNPLV